MANFQSMSSRPFQEPEGRAPDPPPGPWPPEAIAVGEFEARPGTSSLVRHGEVRHLPPQQMDLLLLLARRPGHTFHREEITDALWQGVEVEEGGLSRCVSELRKALGDDARDPRYIETVHKRGYRLVAAVSPPAPARGPESGAPPWRRIWTPRLRLALGAVAILLAIASLAALWPPSPAPPSREEGDRSAFPAAGDEATSGPLLLRKGEGDAGATA